VFSKRVRSDIIPYNTSSFHKKASWKQLNKTKSLNKCSFRHTRAPIHVVGSVAKAFNMPMTMFLVNVVVKYVGIKRSMFRRIWFI